MKPITTERLSIRLAESPDAEAIYLYRSNFLENKYQGWFPESVDEVRDHINDMPQTLDVACTWFQFAIIHTDENRLIGDIGVNISASDKRQAEIGCTLHFDYQGKGYAAEGLGAMINYLFLTLEKHRIIASIDPRNTASIRMVERLGFRKEAHFRESLFLHGEWVDDAIYAILNREWFDNKKQEKYNQAKNIALRFNECINNADINGLSGLMAEDHLFIDTAGNLIKGRANCTVQAWKSFFELYPGYQNIFENVIIRGSTIIMQGHSVCSDEILNNVRAIWVAKVIDNKVALWHIYLDNEENRRMLLMSDLTVD